MSTLPIKLKISRQDLKHFPYFDLTTTDADNWVQDLPITNARLVVEQLRKVVTDLNRIPMAADLRFQILETLRPTQHAALATLRKRFLKQPVVLPDGARQMADMTFNLLRQTITAYITVAIEGIKTKNTITSINPAQLVCEAIHRAITAASGKLLHTYQLYQPVELQGWLELHQLYALAERQNLEQLRVSDNIYGDGTITNTYVRALLLSCCKPNQLRQNDMNAVFRAFRDWAPLCKLTPANTGDGLFLVNLVNDHPPIYRALRSGQTTEDERCLNTSKLIDTLSETQINDARHGKQGIVFDAETALPSGIIGHLITALGVMSQRNFTRNTTNDQLHIGIGLSNAHYHTLSGQSFYQLISGEPEDKQPGGPQTTIDNPFIKNPAEERDPWETTGEHLERIDKSEQATDKDIQLEADYLQLIKPQAGALSDDQRYPVFPVDIINASPGGYCLRWTPDLPGDISAGDLVCLREGKQKPWVIASIRWVSAQTSGDTLIGIELLSPRAIPYAAKTQRKTGPDGEMMRVLLLPEIKLVGQPDTLITPRAGFKEKQKVTLVHNGEERFIQLDRQLTATASFSQFSFRPIKHMDEVATDNSIPLDAEFESIWTQI